MLSNLGASGAGFSDGALILLGLRGILITCQIGLFFPIVSRSVPPWAYAAGLLGTHHAWRQITMFASGGWRHNGKLKTAFRVLKSRYRVPAKKSTHLRQGPVAVPWPSVYFYAEPPRCISVPDLQVWLALQVIPLREGEKR